LGAASMLRLLGLVVLLGANAAGSTAAPAGASDQRFVRPVQELAALLTPHQARQAPRRSSHRLAMVASRRPITGQRTMLPVLRHATDAGGRHWLRVRLPGRPNGHTGWIERAGTVAHETSWRIVVETKRRRVVVYRRGHAMRTFAAVVGKTATPTPNGEFFVEEAVELPSGEAGAPFALALSARSEVFQRFAGGPGQVALHGLANVGGVLGTAVSHGCVRLNAAAMTWLVARIAPGDPVTIRT
ncbi:MAG: L,D-transpeptidase, partial [Gaiella sp.]